MRIEMVGREWEFAAVANCLDAALDGQPRLVLCRGEPGIGKTLLAEELSGLARHQHLQPVTHQQKLWTVTLLWA